MLDGLLNIFFPDKCMFCHGPTGHGERGACDSCRTLYMDDLRPRMAGTKDIRALDSVMYALEYKDGVREAVRGYKFHYKPGYSVQFGRILADVLTKSGAEFDLITCAPVSLRRKMTRGFDHTGLLLDETAKAIGSKLHGSKQFDKNILARRHRPAQSGLKHEQRMSNLKGAIWLKNGKDVAQMSVLVIDDVVTTGSTLEECARVLKSAGAAYVMGLVLASTPE